MTEFGIFWIVIGLPVLKLALGAAAVHHIGNGGRVLPRLPEVPESGGKAKPKKREFIYRGHVVKEEK